MAAIVMVSPMGELDVSNVARVRKLLEAWPAAGHETVILDLSRVTFIDAAFVDLLDEVERGLRRGDGRLEVVNAQGVVARVLDVLGIRHGRLDLR